MWSSNLPKKPHEHASLPVARQSPQPQGERMFTIKNHTGKFLVTLPVLCVAMASVALAADAAKPLAKQGHGAAPLFLTATNGPVNYLAVINTRTKETNYVPTGGVGGAGGNAGGVAVDGQIAAVVNFGSTNVTIFVRQ